MADFIMEPITFFGSGPVAAKSLELLAQNFTIEAVVTKPKPEHHRGDFPVIELANKLGMRLIFARDKAELNKVFAGKPVASKLAVLIDFGIIVSQEVIDYFPLGIVNSHFSLLPEWRGADPITFSILSGQQTTGVSLMLLVAGMDEGPILGFGVYDLPNNITALDLTHDLILLSDALLRDTLPSYTNGSAFEPTGVPIRPRSQEEICHMRGIPYAPTYSRKLTKNDGIIDWSKPASQIEREIRAYIDWPKSRTVLKGLEVIITAAHVVPDTPAAKPGDIELIDNSGVLQIATGDGQLSIEKLKPAGKKEMPVKAFLQGYGQILRSEI